MVGSHRSTRVIASRGGSGGLRDAPEVVLVTIGGTQQSSDFVACGDFLGTGRRHGQGEIGAGIAYGQFVADTIYMIRSSDGFAPDPPPPFAGVDRVGFWRPTAPNAFAAGPQFPTMTPWVLIRGSQFRRPPPPALGSPAYIADYNETKATGRGPAPAPGTPLTAMQTVARFWAGNTSLFWNRIASQVASSRNLSLVETAHLFGMLNVAMADAGIACWDSKFRYVFWRQSPQSSNRVPMEHQLAPIPRGLHFSAPRLPIRNTRPDTHR